MPSHKSVLIVNTGSSSLKWVVLDARSEAIQQQGDATWYASEPGRHEREVTAALREAPKVDAVGHRVVHGGTRFRDSVLIDDRVREEIGKLAELAPLHNPAALGGIDAAVARFPGLPQVASFDTAFHAGIPDAAAIYPLPWHWTERWELRRFGFHGLSVAYSLRRTRELLGALPSRVVVCHLGAGCSVTAVSSGQSVSTSMGFTPLEGLMMARRSGSVDPGLLLFLLNRRGIDPSDLDHALNERSGLVGVSGVSADMREVLAAADRGADRAVLARDIFVHRLIATVGAMVATLRGLDALVFTGGIGEHSPPIRAAVCEGFGYVGLTLESALNTARDGDDRDVATPGSAVKVLVIAAREDLTILGEVKRVLGWE